MFLFQTFLSRLPPPKKNLTEADVAATREQSSDEATDRSLKNTTPHLDRRNVKKLESWMADQKVNQDAMRMVDTMIRIYDGKDRHPDMRQSRAHEAILFYANPLNAQAADMAEASLADWAEKVLVPRGNPADPVRYGQYESTIDFLRFCQGYRAFALSGDLKSGGPVLEPFAAILSGALLPGTPQNQHAPSQGKVVVKSQSLAQTDASQVQSSSTQKGRVTSVHLRSLA